MKITSITYAGHASVFIGTEFIGTNSGTIGLDPWINGNPSCPGNFKVPSDLNLIVLSHGHPDHAGDASSLCKEYGAKIAATYELAMIMAQEGVPQQNVIPMNRGGTVNIDGISVGLSTAFHSSSYETPSGPIYAGEACGIIIKDGTTCIYHAGDTSLFSDMKLIGEHHHPTFALLPIGDHFTMGPEEAAKAAKLVGCKCAIPIHYKTFDVLTGTLEEFKKACARLSVEVMELQPGQTLRI